MQQGQITGTFQIAGLGFTSTVNRTGDSLLSQVVDIPAAVAGAVSSTGCSGLPAGHGLVENDYVDLYWTDGGGVAKSRRGIKLSSSDANTITFDGSVTPEGDALPAVATPVMIGEQVRLDNGFSGDEAVLMAVMLTDVGVIDFRKADGTSALVIRAVANEAWSWAFGQNIANPLAGLTLAVLHVSSGGSASTLRSAVLFQNL